MPAFVSELVRCAMMQSPLAVVAYDSFQTDLLHTASCTLAVQLLKLCDLLRGCLCEVLQFRPVSQHTLL
jgi:hypothetical protein